MGDIDCTTATNHVNNDLSASIYPNPSNGLIYFPEFESETSVQLYDVTGHLIFSQNEITFHQMDLGQFGSGMYLLKLSDERGSRISRVVIE